MAGEIDIKVKRSADVKGGTVIVLKAKDAAATAGTPEIVPIDILERAEKASDFKAARLSTCVILAPHGSTADKLIVLGMGDPESLSENEWLNAGGAAAAAFGKAADVTIFLDMPDASPDAQMLAQFVLGIRLRAYKFDRYKVATKKSEDEGADPAKVKVTVVAASAADAKKALAASEAIAGGVVLARDLVNEPANILGPLEFTEHAVALGKLGVSVEVLNEKDMKKLGMGALLAVGQGSVRPPRLVVMQWQGGKAGEQPVAFVGKGVVFDTGGISIKPAGGMEEMKGDMGGAAAVTGLMHVLAARKAKVNAVGIIGLVENMPDGNAYRPGDVVTSMSGQTIEVLNTDAEGRLVLSDALHYCNDRFKPRLMINLATLTGAIGVALGPHHAGLFCNDDALATALTDAGLKTAEKLWRMPLGKDYDKMIDSKIADMKNTGGRQAGAITAAQFLKRFVGATPWAHLDIASTAMGAPSTEVNASWGSGFGVRLLNAFVADNHEG
ncbi:leucyl aminopeptidase [Rhizobium aquaticum]|uniref:Probable cytosol aminopeptidase n=1 Tax=Rhizobium aquaticum TaxID=1549636 RepID=A0ABV2IZ94_9HYPH